MRAYTQITPDPSTPEEVSDVVAATKQFVASCQRNTPHDVLANVGTRTTIEDLDTLRADLGQPKLNYLGFSYGTYIGELYAQRYPTHIRAMVLDGVINPALGLVGSDKSRRSGSKATSRRSSRGATPTRRATSNFPKAQRSPTTRSSPGSRAATTTSPTSSPNTVAPSRSPTGWPSSE